jgi:hypothetical protein
MIGIAANSMRRGATKVIPEYGHPVNSSQLFKPSDLETMIAQDKKEPDSTVAKSNSALNSLRPHHGTNAILRATT